MRDDKIDWSEVRMRVRAGAARMARALEKVQGLASDAIATAQRPTPLSLLGLGVSAAHAASDLLRGNPHAEAAHMLPVEVPAGCAHFFRAAVQDHVMRLDERSEWRFGEIGGQRVAMYSVTSVQGEIIDFSLRAGSDPWAVVDFVAEETKRRAGPHIALHSAKGAPTIVPAEPPEETPSEAADTIWRRIRPALDAGHTRALMLAGPPGTGKSTIARTLVRRWCDTHPGATTLRVAVSDFGRLDPSEIDGLLGLLHVDVLLVDDLDRFADADQLLDLFEHCHGRQRLVIVTANAPERLPGALRRPGRIDEVVIVEGVGEALARRILGDEAARLTPEQVATCATWPAAHVAELALRLRTVPGVDIAAEVTEIAGRVRANAA